jgi:prepilin peptidase CpaA
LQQGSGFVAEPFHFVEGECAMLSEAIGLTLFPATMAFAAASDLLTMTIANRISLFLVAGFAVVAVLGGLSGAVLFSHFAAGAAVLAAGFACFACGWIGGGDAKLAAATALWLGFGNLFDYLIYSSILGGALTLLILLFRARSLPAALAGSEWAERLHRHDAGIPYGIALAAAALIVYPQSEWMVRLAG